MKKNFKNRSYITLFSLSLLLAIVACSPINKMTSVKRIPKEYVNNYYGEGLKTKGDEYKRKNRGAWIVYSDRAKNPCYLSAGGSVELYKAEFMEAFIVIKKKGNYLKLMKFDPKVVTELKIKEPKKAEYAGWMHKSNLVLENKVFTDISTGMINKYLTAIKDSSSIYNPQKYISQADSMNIYYDMNLSLPKGNVPMYEIVYRVKRSTDNKKSLISKSPILKEENISENVLGWIDNSMLVNIGQQLHMSLPQKTNKIQIKDRTGKDIASIWTDQEKLFSTKEKQRALSYNPVYEIHKNNKYSFYNLKTVLRRPIINKIGNYVYNVNGDKILYTDYLNLEGYLKKINVIFVLENGRNLYNNLSSFVETVQTLESNFQNKDDIFSYKFGAILPFNNEAKIDLTDKYEDLIDFTFKYSEKRDFIASSYGRWSGIRRAVQLLEKNSKDTNLIILIGETVAPEEKVDLKLVNELAKHNCRILGFQTYSNKTNEANNFVIQIEEMIKESVAKIAKERKKIILFSNQVHEKNQFRKIGKNAYKLDYPNKSMLQGGVVFPEKSEFVDMNIVKVYVDTMLNEIRHNNELLISSFENAFNNSGNHRNKFDPILSQYWGIKQSSTPSYEFIQCFKKEIPIWHSPIITVTAPINSTEIHFNLLLTETELQKLQEFIGGLSKHQPDRISRDQSKIQNNKRYNYGNEFDLEKEISGNTQYYKYRQTEKIRKYLSNYFVKSIYNAGITSKSRNSLKKYNLTQALQRITPCPAQNKELLDRIKISDITNKKKLSDTQLDMLIRYFKDKKDFLNKAVKDLETFESNGEKYYRINQELLL